MKKLIKSLNTYLLRLCMLLLLSFHPVILNRALAQNNPGNKSEQINTSAISELPFYFPQTLYFGSGNSIMTPTGLGASNNTIFAGGGVAFRQVYADDPDGSEYLGVGLGNPYRNIGFVLTATVNDLSGQDNISYGFKMHKCIGRGTSIAFGGTQLFRSDESDGRESFYFAVSHTLQNLPSASPGRSLLILNIGIGNGQFSHKSEMDIAKGKGKYGTGVFGSIAYGLLKNTSLIVEWSGLNLNTGFSMIPLKKIPFYCSLGLVDLTSNSGDGVRMVCSGGLYFKIFNNK